MEIFHAANILCIFLNHFTLNIAKPAYHLDYPMYRVQVRYLPVIFCITLKRGASLSALHFFTKQCGFHYIVANL